MFLGVVVGGGGGGGGVGGVVIGGYGEVVVVLLLEIVVPARNNIDLVDVPLTVLLYLLVGLIRFCLQRM